MALVLSDEEFDFITNIPFIRGHPYNSFFQCSEGLKLKVPVRNIDYSLENK